VSPARLADVGAVVIGRNEGERLERCLDSLVGTVAFLVYADSGSSDGSAERVRARGIEVVELPRGEPMNAARGRNAGFARLRALAPELAYVFFVDGDCRVEPGFLGAARAELERDSGLGAVCGRRRELWPEASLYNRVVDCEWNTPVGPCDGFGGDVLVRAAVLHAIGGYDPRLNQGEDPETAYRVRQAGFRILRIAHDMTRHDVGLATFAAWRRRHRRGGYAYAHGAALHLGEPGHYNQRAVLSILAWGAVLPVLALAAAPFLGGISLALFLLYGLQWGRIRAHRRRQGDTARAAGSYALLITYGKFEEALGVLSCIWALMRGREARVIEYKPPAAAVGETRRAA
jgi:GT2 family glycosyltransferase